MIKFTTDINVKIELNENEFIEAAKSAIECALNEKEYNLHELTPELIAEDITGIGGSKIDQKGLDIIQSVLTETMRIKFD